MRVPVAADGTFEGSMSLQGIRQDWYAFSVTDGDEGVYTSKSFSIEHYQKPAYRITVTPDKDWYYATDPVTFTIEASYYDGTPLSGGELTFSGDYMGSAGPDGPSDGHPARRAGPRHPHDQTEPRPDAPGPAVGARLVAPVPLVHGGQLGQGGRRLLL